MDFKRVATPPPPAETDLIVPQTPGAPQDALPRIVIPPSPYGPRLDAFASFSKSTKLRAAPQSKKRSQTTGAGVQKVSSKAAKPGGNLASIVDAAFDGANTVGFMDLPGEIRNLIYSYSCGDNCQALLVHRPRIASLRLRTRLDRQRTLVSDVVDQEQDEALASISSGGRAQTRGNRRKPKSALLPRESNRPFFGLTQVCRLLRQEFRPIYLQRQEIGMDLVDAVPYLNTFYYEAPALLEKLSTSNDRKIDMPFTGNVTIAIGDVIKKAEKAEDGVDVWPLLDLWANSFKIEAGFGRYLNDHYDATADGEAKDLYRLFGRCVQPDRRCSKMNILWRTILRTRSLAAVCVHRHSAPPTQVAPSVPTQFAAVFALRSVTHGPRPYIHVIFRHECAEAWMTALDSQIPFGWLAAHGFDGMEYFDVKVGAAPASAQ